MNGLMRASVAMLMVSCVSIGGAAEVSNAKMKALVADVEKAEPYSKFLATEKRVIAERGAEYLALRNAYLVEMKYVTPEAQNPKKALGKLMKALDEKKVFADDEARGEYNDAAWLVAMELIVDRPSFDVPLDGLRITKDITFATYPEIDLELDLFLPEKQSKKSIPCIVCIHGGGWRVHRRAWFNGHAAYFARNGMAAVSVDYRMFPAVKDPSTCVQDVKAAVRWIRANAKKYGIDPDRIGAVGGSAGAHLSAMLATTAGVEALEGDGGNAGVSSAIQAAVGYATPAFDPDAPKSKKPKTWMTPETVPLVSPLVNVEKDSAPLLLIHGTADKTVPIRNSVVIEKAYRNAGAVVEYMVLQDKPHVFYTRPEAAQWALEFFQKQFGVKVKQGGKSRYETRSNVGIQQWAV